MQAKRLQQFFPASFAYPGRSSPCCLAAWRLVG